MSGKKMRLRWTLEARDIPEGWVRLTSFGYDKSKKRPSDDYKTIYACIQQGIISADQCIKFRLTPTDDRGPIYVDPAAASKALSNYSQAFAARRDGAKPVKQEAQRAEVDERHAESVCESLASIGDSLDGIRRLLGKLADAAECIATQPKSEPAGTWRDMNGESL